MGQIIVEGKKFNIEGDEPSEKEQVAIREALGSEKPANKSNNDILLSIGQGSGRGIAKGIGAPVDLANLALSFFGLGSEEPFGGSRSVQKGFKSLGIGAGPDEKLPNEFIGRVSEEVGAATVPFGVTGALSRGAITDAARFAAGQASRGGTASNLEPSITKAIGDFFRTRPGQLAGSEIGAATTAGLGAAVSGS